MNNPLGIDEAMPILVEKEYRNGIPTKELNGVVKSEHINGIPNIERLHARTNSPAGAALKLQPEPLQAVGVVGLGYWGPNWVRNFHQSRFAKRIVACDLDEERREHVSQLYSGLETTSRFEDLLNDPYIEGIVV